MSKNVKKICAWVCTMIIAVSAFVSVPFYASDNGVNESLTKLSLPTIEGLDKDCDYILFSLDDKIYLVGARSDEGVIGAYRYYDKTSGSGYFGLLSMSNYRAEGSDKYADNSLNYAVLYALEGDYWNCTVYDGTIWSEGGLRDLSSASMSTLKVYFSTVDIYYWDCSYNGLFYSADKDETYNSNLGYLQDIKGQFLYLEDDAWDLVEDTAVNKYTFSNITTTGLDITDGDWDIRLYGQLVIRDLDNDAEITVYDKVYLGEYSASDLKIMIPYKETNEQINNASGFDGLSWWEAEFLHYYTFYNTYLQLVRTNSDGTVEYGGFLKIWKASNNVTYTDTLDENGNVYDEGYVNKPIENGSHGSGSTYEEAEKDAAKNEEEREQHNSDMSDLENALSGFTSTLGVVPNVIASVFSFLPPWCLNLCAVGFGLLIVLIIWKTARG